MSGQFLPKQLIYQGTTDRCLPKGVEFPDDWDVTYIVNNWSNESKAIQHLQTVVFPYIKKRKVKLQLPENRKAIAVSTLHKLAQARPKFSKTWAWPMLVWTRKTWARPRLTWPRF